MSFINQTAFQFRRSNDRYEDLQTITGLFGAASGDTFAGADCSAGFLCNKGAGIPAGGFQMTVAADGSDELYACNTTDIQRLSNGANTWAVGVETLGLGIPADSKGAYTHLRAGETYAFGPGNFSTLMSAELPYATVANGLLVASASAPEAGAGYYFEMDTELGIDWFVEGNGNAFARYNLMLKKA